MLLIVPSDTYCSNFFSHNEKNSINSRMPVTNHRNIIIACSYFYHSEHIGFTTSRSNNHFRSRDSSPPGVWSDSCNCRICRLTFLISEFLSFRQYFLSLDVLFCIVCFDYHGFRTMDSEETTALYNYSSKNIWPFSPRIGCFSSSSNTLSKSTTAIALDFIHSFLIVCLTALMLTDPIRIVFLSS